MFSAAIKSGAAGSPTDPQFKYVTMLLHGDGTNGAQNNTFLDSSTNNFTITRNGNTTQGTFTPYGSNWSNYFSSSSYLSIANATPLQLSGNQFTIEGWFFFSTSGVDSYIVSQASGSADANVNYVVRVTTTDKLRFLVMSSATPTYFDGTTTVTANTWHHFACVCDGSGAGAFLRSWLDGVYQGASSSFNAASINTNAAATQIAAYSAVSSYSTGYVSNIRILKGTALYTGTSNITVPTAPLTAITNTSLLTCQSNRFIDNSSNAYTVTANGSPSVQRFSPFSPTSAYSTSVIGGSGYFDGSGDYLSLADNAALQWSTGDFCVEAWIYPSSVSGSKAIVCKGTNNTGTFDLGLYGAKIELYTNVLVFSSSASIVANTWTHVAVTRSGTTLRCFINGALDTTVTSSYNFNNAGSFYVGVYGSAAVNYFNGYMSDVRCVKGSAVYTSAFTPPTAPLTAITNTSLLNNYTNAGILDNAEMNDLETVGNAQISTSVKKYGTGSISFDGTDDRLVTAANPSVSFGTGDFTVEAWIYPNVLTGERGFIQTSSTSGGLQTSYTNGIVMLINVSPYQLTANVGGTNITSSVNISATTWTHVALTRASGSVRLFVNGTLVGGPTTVTANLDGQNIVIGGYYSTTYLWNGYLDDVRITKGYARYTSSFTAPTAAFPNN